MSTEKQQAQIALYTLKGMLSEAPQEKRDQYQAAHDELRAFAEKHGETGDLAIQMYVMQMVAEGDE